LSARIKFPLALEPIFTPKRGDVRYRCAYGGRGSGKSFSFALWAAFLGYQEKLRILCTRELQVSIKESMHAELKNVINSIPWLAAHYDVGVDYLRGKNGTEFIFRGLRHNMSSIKSMAQIDICLIEEGEDIPEKSWLDLEPTIRAPKSEIWVVWNPRTENSPVDDRFIKNTPPRCAIAKVNYSDNPWFPDVLEEQRQHAQKTMDSGLYAHIWEGYYWSNSDAQILKDKWTVQEFTAGKEERFFFGADWGFAQDPTAITRGFIRDQKFYIDYAVFGYGVDIEDLPELFKQVPGADQWPIKADSSRPETISAMRRRGLNVQAAKKWPGSVEDGIAYLRSFDQIVIHPRCKALIEECRLYSFKRDRLTDEVLPVVVDAFNHCISEGTLIETKIGLVPIEDIKSGDYVLTRAGYRPVTKTWNNGLKETVLLKYGENELRLTHDHLIYVNNRGFAPVDALRYNDDILILSGSRKWLMLKFLNIARKYIDDTQTAVDGLIEFITRGLLQEGQFGYIDRYGLTIMGIYQNIFTSIIKMAIQIITIFQILSALPINVICRIIQRNGIRGNAIKKELGSILKKLDRLQKLGIVVEKGVKSIWKLVQWPIRILSQLIKNAYIAPRHSKQKQLVIETNFAQTHVSQHIEETQELTTLSEIASGAKKILWSTNIQTRLLARSRAQCINDGVIKKVYDLSVDGQHEYFANGVLVHNCIDAMRYSLDGYIHPPYEGKRSMQVNI